MEVGFGIRLGFCREVGADGLLLLVGCEYSTRTRERSAQSNITGSTLQIL